VSISYVCPVCGLDYETVTPMDGIVAIRSFPRRYRAALAAAMEDESDDGIVRRRPEPEVWSALEYTAHVVDVLSGIKGYIHELRTRDTPTLADPTSSHFDTISKGGGSIEAAVEHLTSAATALADELDKVQADDWHRTGNFSWGERDLLDTMRNAVHEGSHHLRDVEKVLDQVRGKG
jgi:hypothetical protein